MKHNARNNPTPMLGYDSTNSEYNIAEVNADGLQFNAGYHWNTVSLEWEANTGGTTAGPDVNVTNFPAVISGASVPVTLANLFDNLANFKISDMDSDQDPSYFGFVDKDGNWYIMQMTDSTEAFRYIKGTTGYTTNWGNRLILSYAYFYNTF